MKALKWIIQYDTLDSDEERICGLSSLTLCDYKISLLTRQEYRVDIISPSITQKKWKFFSRKTKILNSNVRLILFSTFGLTGKFGLFVSKMVSMVQLFIYLLLNVKKNEIIVVSHSLIFCMPVYLAKKIRKFQLLLDFGEEYNKVKKGNKIYQYFEPKLIKAADKFIFSNNLLTKAYGVERDKAVVIYGQYIRASETNIKDKIADNRTHVVYAGIISSDEGSVYRAIELANYLDENFCIHILGEVPKHEEKKFYSLIERSLGGCQVIYEGVKKGKEFFDTLSQYHIGLNLRDSKAEYIDFAFPSKCLTYLSAGIHVVSSDIKCVRKSKVGNLIHFYTKNSLEDVAQTIKQVDLNSEYKPNEQLVALDQEAAEKLALLLS